MKKYQSHKIVQAAKITAVHFGPNKNDPLRAKDAGTLWLDDGTHVEVSGGQFSRTEVGGYFVLYSDGYCSYSPAAAFEKGYAELVDGEAVTGIQTCKLPYELAKASQCGAGNEEPAGIGMAQRQVALESALRADGGSHERILKAAQAFENYLAGQARVIMPADAQESPKSSAQVDANHLPSRFQIGDFVKVTHEDFTSGQAWVRGVNFTESKVYYVMAGVDAIRVLPSDAISPLLISEAKPAVGDERARLEAHVQMERNSKAGIELPNPPSPPTSTGQAPKVEEIRIDALMASLTYDTAHLAGTTSTVATARLPGGFVVAIGHSATVNAANFDPAKGREFAIKSAERKARAALWEMEGYALFLRMEQLRAAGIDAAMPAHQQRLLLERIETDDRRDKLRAFVATAGKPGSIFDTLPEAEQKDLRDQLDAMELVSACLALRISRMKAAAKVAE